jgi:hypothetical protein
MNEALVGRRLAMILFSALITACAGSDADVADTAVADVLWLPGDAVLERDAARPIAIQNGRSIYVDGSAAVGFSINIEREQLSERIVRHFAEAGWRQRKTRYLNPYLPTSFARGWENRGRGLIVAHPPDRRMSYEPYFEWHGEWQNQRGAVVSYALGGLGRQLRGYAQYLPRDVVEYAKRRLLS